MFQMEIEQLVDLITSPEDEIDLSKFSLKERVHTFSIDVMFVLTVLWRQSPIVIYKTAYYSFYLPVAFTMYMSHISHVLNRC